MFRRTQIVGFFLLLVALMTGTTWLAQAGDDGSPGDGAPDLTVVTALETSTTSDTSVSPTTQPPATSPETTSPNTTTSELTTTSTLIETTSTASTSVAETTTTSSTTTETTVIETTTGPSTTADPTKTTVAETTIIETTIVETTTEPATTTTEAQSSTVKVSGQAGLRLGTSVSPGPNLLRLNFFDQTTDERVQSIVYTGLTNTGDYSAELRTDVTYRVDVIVCCNAPTVTLSFRDLSFDADTALDLTVPAVEVVFEVVSEAGGPVANATIVIPAASGSNDRAAWSARVYAAPTDENGETRTVLPIGTSSSEERLPTLELEDGVKTTFQFTVLGGRGTDVPVPTEPPPTTVPATTAPPATSTSTTISVPATTDTTTTVSTTTTTELTTTESTPIETIATTAEATLLAALDGELEGGTDASAPIPTTESVTTEQASPELTTTILETTSVPDTDQPDTSSPDTTDSPNTTDPDVGTPDTSTPDTTTDTASPDNPDPIAPTPDGTNTVRITLVAPTSIELSGEAGLEILGELTPGSHSLRINFYRADTDELGAQVTYTGEDNDGSYETHLIAGAAYRVEVIVCCEGPTVRLVYDDVVFSESTLRDFLVPAAEFEIKVVDHNDAAADDATIIFNELSGTASDDTTPWYASGQPKFDSDAISFPVVLPIGSVISTDQAGEDVGPTSLILGENDAVSFTIPSITFNINTLLIKLNEDGDSVVAEPALTRPWVTPTLSTEANEAGWINEEAEISWTVTDPAPEVGLPQTTLPPTPVDKEGTHTYWSEEACDLDENCSKRSLEVSLDSEAPSVGIHGFVKGALRTTEPTPTCTAEDSGSGLLVIIIDSDDSDDESASSEEADCSLETKVRSSEPIVADDAGDSDGGTDETDEEASEGAEQEADSEGTDESAELSEPTLFLTTYEVTATATDIAGNVTTEVETYQIETEEQVEVTAALPETTISETTTVPEATNPDTNPPEADPPVAAPPETVPPETEETLPIPGPVSRSRLVQLR